MVLRRKGVVALSSPAAVLYDSSVLVSCVIIGGTASDVRWQGFIRPHTGVGIHGANDNRIVRASCTSVGHVTTWLPFNSRTRVQRKPQIIINDDIEVSQIHSIAFIHQFVSHRRVFGFFSVVCCCRV